MSRHSHRAAAPVGLASRRAPVVAAHTGLLIAAALVVGNPLILGGILLACLCTLKGSDRLRASLPYFRVGLYAGLTILVINPIFSTGGINPLFATALGPFHLRLTWEGIAFGAGQALHLVTIIVAFATTTLVLDQDYQLSLLSRLSTRSALVVSLATRLLPVLSRDATRISDAQRSRGAELDRGRWRDRAAARGPLLAGLLTQSLERATDVAASMEARGFGRAGRTRWSRHLRWKPPDHAVVATAASAFLLLIVGTVQGRFSLSYFPVIANPLDGLLAPTGIGLVLLTLIPSLWSLQWRPSSP